MKNYIFIIIFLIVSIELTAQGNSKYEFQKDRFDLGESFLQKGQNEKAIQLFFFAYHIIPDNELGQIAYKKYDSLKSIVRENLLKNISGNWKKISTDSNWVMPDENGLIGEMLTINSNEILFFELYKKSKEWCFIKTEPVIFCKKAEIATYIDYDSNFTEFVYKNKEVWRYSIDENSGILNAYFIGFETENGVSEMICGNSHFQYFKLQ
ncbi:hypothetical protein [Flavobacterium sp. PL02]|uniref:hypothetical protein n=1 Tax=Flavobacterium sp. PL02 TaxID=3088354 RepID=UPI002B235A2E|nr:hypothetical protein [Flavobacterium sp. PL02]MEA9415747.1 hypothetical protein [Flavobacterium sp. PL02]